MVSDKVATFTAVVSRVLILVLMEYGLWQKLSVRTVFGSLGLNPCSNGIWSLTMVITNGGKKLWRLNPCSNGIWSLTEYISKRREDIRGLNPCSNGIWSLTYQPWGWGTCHRVLILVLMEYGLWLEDALIKAFENYVLILVLMEYGLWLTILFNISTKLKVLILVLMEYGLWLCQACRKGGKRCLNPCSNGIWSLTSKQDSGSEAGDSLNPCSNGIWSLTRLSSCVGTRV